MILTNFHNTIGKTWGNFLNKKQDFITSTIFSFKTLTNVKYTITDICAGWISHKLVKVLRKQKLMKYVHLLDFMLVFFVTVPPA